MSTVQTGSIDYKINEVLGPKFKQSYEMMKNNGLSTFLVKNLTNKPGYGAQDNDIWYQFSDLAIAISAAFRHIEKPDIRKIQVTSQYASNISTIVSELLNSTSVDLFGPRKKEFEFQQLPYFVGKYNSIEHLVHGFNLLPYIPGPYKVETRSQNAFINAIRYLYHFIALLDINGLRSQDVMEFLSTDEKNFTPYVDAIVDSLMSTDYFSNKIPYATADRNDIEEAIRAGVERGLQAIVQKIISKYNGLGTTNIGIDESDIDKFKSQAENFIQFLENIGYSNTTARNIYGFFQVLKWNQVKAVGDNAKNVIPEPQILDKYRINALLNPDYMTNTELYVKESILPYKQIQKGGQGTGLQKRSKKTGAPGALDLPVALEFLYAPPLPDTLTSAEIDALTREFRRVGIIDNSESVQKGDRIRIDIAYQSNQQRAQFVNNAIKIPATMYTNTWQTISGFAKFIATQPVQNWARVIVLSILYYMLTDAGKDFTALVPNDDDKKIIQFIKKNLRGYSKIQPRLDSIPTSNFATEFQDLRDVFVTEFLLGSYGKLDVDQGMLKPYIPSSTTTTTTGKTNLADPEIRNFYKEIVVKDVDFYGQFFNLIKQGVSTDLPLDTAKDEPDAELVKYRLNVKKAKGQPYLPRGGRQRGGRQRGGRQRGGQEIEIVYTANIPDYTGGNLFIRIEGQRDPIIVPEEELQKRGVDALRYISRTVYSSTGPTVQLTWGSINPITINLAQTIDRAKFGLFDLNMEAILADAVKNVLVSPSSTLRVGWKDDNIKLSDHLLEVRSRWERQGDKYVYRDDKDNEVKVLAASDNCLLIQESTQECLEFFSSCLGSTGDHLSEACKQLFNFKFNINPAIDVLTDNIQKMDPTIAFGILKQFKFGQDIEEEKNYPVPGFRRFKIQSVSSWLNEMRVPKTRCNENREICGSLREELGPGVADAILKMTEDETKRQFFDYLSVLVHWVNANPQILNVEESKDAYYRFRQKYPPTLKSFETYSYVNPHKPAEYRLRTLSCGLERLKYSIIGQLTGSRPETTASLVAAVPLGIQMPLGRQAFTYPLNPYNLSMFGGGHHYYDSYIIDNEFNNDYQFGYKFFESIFGNLNDEMNEFNTTHAYNRTGKKLGLSEQTRSNIRTKLDNLKVAENDLRDSIIRLIKQKELYELSRGHINLEGKKISDEEFATLLAKHSNLINAGKVYNKKAENMIDMLQIITKAILEKVDKTQSAPTSTSFNVTRPLIPGFRYDYNFFKNN